MLFTLTNENASANKGRQQSRTGQQLNWHKCWWPRKKKYTDIYILQVGWQMKLYKRQDSLTILQYNLIKFLEYFTVQILTVQVND